MKTFQCSCTRPLVFQNLRCAACGAEVAYDPTSQVLGALTSAAADRSWTMSGDIREARPELPVLC